MSKRLLPLLLVFALAGCVSAPAPIPAGYAGPLARINDSAKSVSATKIQFFQLARVDERNIQTSGMATYQANYGRGFAMDPVVESREVPARQCVLHLEGVTHVAADILAFGGGMYHVEGEVPVILQADKVYFVKGELSKEYSAVWLEDAEGHIASPKIEKGKR